MGSYPPAHPGRHVSTVLPHLPLPTTSDRSPSTSLQWMGFCGCYGSRCAVAVPRWPLTNETRLLHCFHYTASRAQGQTRFSSSVSGRGGIWRPTVDTVEGSHVRGTAAGPNAFDLQARHNRRPRSRYTHQTQKTENSSVLRLSVGARGFATNGNSGPPG